MGSVNEKMLRKSQLALIVNIWLQNRHTVNKFFLYHERFHNTCVDIWNLSFAWFILAPWWNTSSDLLTLLHIKHHPLLYSDTPSIIHHPLRYSDTHSIASAWNITDTWSISLSVNILLHQTILFIFGYKCPVICSCRSMLWT